MQGSSMLAWFVHHVSACPSQLSSPGTAMHEETRYAWQPSQCPLLPCSRVCRRPSLPSARLGDARDVCGAGGRPHQPGRAAGGEHAAAASPLGRWRWGGSGTHFPSLQKALLSYTDCLSRHAACMLHSPCLGQRRPTPNPMPRAAGKHPHSTPCRLAG